MLSVLLAHDEGTLPATKSGDSDDFFTINMLFKNNRILCDLRRHDAHVTSLQCNQYPLHQEGWLQDYGIHGNQNYPDVGVVDFWSNAHAIIWRKKRLPG